MSDETGELRFTEMQWRVFVGRVIANQPELISPTVEGLQDGTLTALERQRERAFTLSLGLVEALNSKPGAVRRDRERIVAAVKVSQFHPTPWSKKIINREQPTEENADGDNPA